ncbi:histidine kinase [Rhodococcoides trifolii]|uniref:Histidine kinase n=1 Tax=Rhodococcoides trifolii TaxID=908250 RepID=A0A917G0H5_9NOCA|nr:histidine kinase [Rhodococcus trifolii]GGG16322.1 histidine kinase [Rhodococcus trifolii]
MRLRDYLNPMHGWNDSSDVDKVRVYTRQSFLVIVVGLAVAMLSQSVAEKNTVTAAAALAGTAAAAVILQRTESMGGPSRRSRRPPLVVLVAASAVMVAFGSVQNILWTSILMTTAVAALVTLRWAVAAAVVVVVIAGLLGAEAVQIVLLGMFIVLMAFTVRLSMWLLRLVVELEATRDAAGALSVAEERLRFSRDLHDVVGRALSAIAVKSELAATLARRGDDRAAAQMDEVRALAQESMSEARELVRGYRSVDVASELVGARSLLSAAGIRTELIGDVSAVPHRVAEPAAWVVREGVTNILRHSSASFCRIEFDVNTIRIVNDEPAFGKSTGDGTGLSGLRERLAAVGGVLTVESNSDTFSVTATFRTGRDT